jgi:hypothetical protein
MLFLGACSSNNAADESGSDTTVDTRITPPTIAAGTQIELGSITSEIQELSDKCAKTLQPIRDLEKKYQSGLEMTDADRPAFNKALSDGFNDCSPDEWTAFQEKELKGWMNAKPSEAAERAAEEAAQDAQDAATETTAPATTDEAATSTTPAPTTTVK